MNPGGTEVEEIVHKNRRQSKAQRFKQLLTSMKLNTPWKFDHTEYYCTGQGMRCTLTHYTSQLKQRGIGEWKVEHIKGEPGMAVVIRIS